ncbi:MAG: type II toxin-antitoxin system HicB family antitoxin [Bacteroidota bacterium]
MDFAVKNLTQRSQRKVAKHAKKKTILFRNIRMDFKIILEKDDDGWFAATCPALPGCISQGKIEEFFKLL